MKLKQQPNLQSSKNHLYINRLDDEMKLLSLEAGRSTAQFEKILKEKGERVSEIHKQRSYIVQQLESIRKDNEGLNADTIKMNTKIKELAIKQLELSQVASIVFK